MPPKTPLAKSDKLVESRKSSSGGAEEKTGSVDPAGREWKPLIESRFLLRGPLWTPWQRTTCCE